ncbi:MAG: sugar-binding protein [Verrucomicrobiota bacterium]
MKPSYLSTLGALFTSLALLGSAAAQDPIADIRHTPSTITIDGVADEAVWGSANEYTNFEHAASEPPDSEDDLSAKWRALWDEENLYFFIEVTDDATVLDDNNDWQDDSIEIYIDAEALSRTGDEPVDDYRPGEWPIYQLTVLAGSNKLHNGINHAFWGELNPDADLETGEVGGNEIDFYPMNGVGSFDGTNYSLEVALPWTSLGDITPDAILDRGLFGLGFAVNDDDDEEGRDHQIMWGTSNGDLWMSAVQFPSVQLLVPEGPGPDIFVRSKADLGRLSAAEMSHSRTVEIRNVGTENALMVTGVTVTGPDAGSVTIDEQPSMIEPSGVGELKYTLTPGRTGDFQFGFEITTNDVDAEDQTKTVSVSAAIINSAGPAAHFAMDDAVGSTEMRDITGYGRHGTYSGGVLGQEALATGTAVLFNGSEFGTVSTDDLISEKFTVSLWLDGAEVGGTQLVIGQGEGNPIFGLLLQDGAPAWFADGGVEFVAEDATVAAGEKRLLTATYDGETSTVVLYLDGAAVATQEGAAEVQLGSGEPWSIGSFGGVLGFNGTIDDVQIYTRVLAAEDVQGLFDDPGSVPSAFVGGELPDGAIAGDAGLGGTSGLSGYYWNVGVKEVPTTGEPMHREGDGPDGADTSNSGWADNNVFNRPITGSFDATTFEYAGNDLTPIGEWLGADAASYEGADGNLDDGVFRFVGYVYAAEPGPRTIDFNAGSDDGAVVYIGDEAIVENDNGHGEGDAVSGTYDFPAQGFYPIDIRYFNGDWTNDAGDHGGANFRNNTLADLTLFQTVEGVDPFYVPDGAEPVLPNGAIAGGPELAGEDSFRRKSL